MEKLWVKLLQSQPKEIYSKTSFQCFIAKGTCINMRIVFKHNAKHITALSIMLLSPFTRPGSLKRGMNVSVLEESLVKRSRTSSISSVSGCPVSCGVPGSARNPIRSSYSSSQGYPQVAYIPMYLHKLSEYFLFKCFQKF